MACHYGHLIIFVAFSHVIQFQQTALHMACESDHVEIAVTLLKHGANVNKRNNMVSVGKPEGKLGYRFCDVVSLCSHWLIHSLTVPPVMHGNCVL